ncbi:MAG TPA: alpha/beta hydrolase [Flavobacteriaceae bacterium]|nr:alpha/beta hydrolase [Flavobacteriaceae bacterium]
MRDKTPVYFVPGMAAGPQTFENIHLPEDRYEIKILEWLIPEKDESLVHYAKRMAERIADPNPVLVGVSFGGVVAQEMVQFLQVRKIIIISSVKTSEELPLRMKLTGMFKIYNVFPTATILSTDDLTKFSVGPKSKKRLQLYQKYLDVRDKIYLDWAIKQMVTWKREESVQNLIHIHGEEDQVFPIKHIQDCIVVKGGTHVMLLTKGRELSHLLEEVINK